MKNMKLISGIVLAVLVISACGSSSGELTAQDAWARPANAGENGAAYFIIENRTTADDTLWSVSSEIAAAAEVHMSMRGDNGVISMQKQEFVILPAKDKVEFKPGDLNMMFVSLTRDLKVGDSIMLTLNFEKAGSLTVEVPVEER